MRIVLGRNSFFHDLNYGDVGYGMRDMKSGIWRSLFAVSLQTPHPKFPIPHLF